MKKYFKFLLISLLILSTIGCTKNKTYAVINIDNLVQIDISKDYKVINITSLNNDSYDNINSSSLEEVVSQTVDILKMNNYLKSDITINTNIDDKQLDFMLNQYLSNKLPNVTININK